MATARVATTIPRFSRTSVYSSGDPCGRHARLGALWCIIPCKITRRQSIMDIIGFFRVEQTRLHHWTRIALEDLTPEEWHYTIDGNTNNIAFLVWHSARTEDNILRLILQGRPTIWAEGGWHERLGLPPRVQGTGMANEEARAFHIADTALFMQYVEQVWSEYEAYLAAISDGGKALSERTV